MTVEDKSSPPVLKLLDVDNLIIIWPKLKSLLIISPEAPDVPPDTIWPTLNFEEIFSLAKEGIKKIISKQKEALK